MAITADQKQEMIRATYCALSSVCLKSFLAGTPSSGRVFLDMVSRLPASHFVAPKEQQLPALCAGTSGFLPGCHVEGKALSEPQFPPLCTAPLTPTAPKLASAWIRHAHAMQAARVVLVTVPAMQTELPPTTTAQGAWKVVSKRRY
jgi:hypothetical protein